MEFITYNNKTIPIANSFNGSVKTNSKDTNVRYSIKFNRMAKIAKNIDKIEKKLFDILEANKNVIDMQCAFAIIMMIKTGIRVGNENSAEGYTCNIKNHPSFGKKIQTYGLTTLKKEHINIISENEIKINFLGKKAVEQNIDLKDPILIKWSNYFLKKLKNENWLDIDAGTLKKFIDKNIGKYQIKDFRTLKANLVAGTKISEIQTLPKPKKIKEINDEVKAISLETSNHLGNTPGICKKSYINPEIINWHIIERFPEYFNIMKERAKKRKKRRKKKPKKNLQLKKK